MIQLSNVQVCRDKLGSNTVMKSYDGSRKKAKYNTLGDNWLNIQGLINWLENALNDNRTIEVSKDKSQEIVLKMFRYIEESADA